MGEIPTDQDSDRAMADGHRRHLLILRGPGGPIVQVAMSGRQVIYFDVSDVVEFVRSNVRLSGIQRVSVEIVKYLSARGGDHELRLICYHPTLKRMVWFSAAPFDADYAFDHSGFCRYFAISPRREQADDFGQHDWDVFVHGKAHCGPFPGSVKPCVLARSRASARRRSAASGSQIWKMRPSPMNITVSARPA